MNTCTRSAKNSESILWFLSIETIGIRAHSDSVGGNLLLWKIYAMTECVIIEIGIQTHLHCMKNINFRSSHLMKLLEFLAYSMTSINGLNPTKTFINRKSVKKVIKKSRQAIFCNVSLAFCNNNNNNHLFVLTQLVK